jgi:chlorophyll synthase
MTSSNPDLPTDEIENISAETAPEASTEPVSAASSKGARARQMLGMKGAEHKETSIWKLRLQLMKPITWIPLIWGVVCGAASSGHYTWTIENVLISAACMLMAGPLLAGYTQTINDYYDREIDAINEPYRPIPSGAIPLNQVIAQIWILLLAGVLVAAGLDLWAGHSFPTITVMAILGSFVSLYLFRTTIETQAKWLAG